MSDAETKAEGERVRTENAALKKGASSGIRLKVSEKGAVSVYGMGRFPVKIKSAYRRVNATDGNPTIKRVSPSSEQGASHARDSHSQNDAGTFRESRQCQ